MAMKAGEQVQVYERHAAILAELQTGATIRDVAARVGCSVATVHKVKVRHVAQLAEEQHEAATAVFHALDAERHADLEEIDGVIRRAKQEGDDKTVLAALAVRDRYLSSLAKLWGVDDAAPLRRAGLTSALSVVRSAPASLRDEWMGLLRSGDPSKIARVEREAREYMARMDAPPMAVIDVGGA